MGTELQYAVNLLATLPEGNEDVLDEVQGAYLWACSRKRFPEEENKKTGFEQLQESMDRLLEQYNKESVRRTMMNQEEIFKEQIKELHRLYRVQKMLMAELRSKELKSCSLANMEPSDYVDPDRRTGFRSPSSAQTSNSYFSNNYHQGAQTTFDYNFHQRSNVRPDPSSQEASSCSRDTFRIRRGFDIEQPTGEDTSNKVGVIHDQAPNFRWPTKDKMVITGSHDLRYDPDGESDIELTLSIGYGKGKNKLKHRPHSNLELSCSESTPNETRQPIPATSAKLDQEEECGDRQTLQRPHWLFQTLSLNRT